MSDSHGVATGSEVAAHPTVPTAPTLPATIVYVPGSHLDLYWLGSYLTCLDRGADIIRDYLERCLEHPDETFVIETAVFAEHFVRSHPEHEESLKLLLQQGRVEIGAAYIDAWENLVLGESHIRNLQFGTRWLREKLDYLARTAVHPDLPGLNAQTAQVSRQCGVEFYATARKMFPEGRVWRAVSPDGSAMLVLRWCGHYNFIPLTLSDLPAELPRWGDWEVSLDDIDQRFPLGTLAIAAAAGDLTTAADFENIYGQPLARFIEQYRQRHPDIEFGYSTPAAVLAPYSDADIELAETSQAIPSVWGVAADESVDFFRQSRRSEALLLAAETATVIAAQAGTDRWPAAAREWKGTFHEDAFFARKDLIPAGEEFSELWRMHLFTQDHNGGGQQGVLSSYHKRIRQERVIEYSEQLISQALRAASDTADADSSALLAFNPTLKAGASVQRIEAASAAGAVLAKWRNENDRLAEQLQPIVDALGAPLFAVAVPAIPAIGCRSIGASDLLPDIAPADAGAVASPATASTPAEVVHDQGQLTVTTPHLVVGIDTATGRITRLRDRAKDVDLADSVGRLRAVPEVGNDVTLRTDESAPVEAKTVSVDVVADGPLATQVRIVQDFLDCRWTQLLTIWANDPRLDLEVGVRWPGTAGWQIRLGLAQPASTTQLTYGGPFHATDWADVPAGAGPRGRDEIDPDDYPRYREVQHWTHVAGPAGGVTITGDAIGMYHNADGALEAVLMRTVASCGDEHFTWNNAGPQLWRLSLHFGETSWAAAGAPELGDRMWRRPLFVPASGSACPRGLLSSSGDPVLLSALYPSGRSHRIRIANIRPTGAEVVLSGPLIVGPAKAVDLTDNPAGEIERLAPDRLLVRLPAWRIQTIQVEPPLPLPAESNVG